MLKAIFDITTSIYYLRCVGLLAAIIFGSGIYGAYERKNATEAIQRQAQAELAKCRPGNLCPVKSLEMTVFLERSARRVSR